METHKKNLFPVSWPKLELHYYSPLPATRVSRTLAHTMEVKPAKIINTTKVFENL